MLSDKELLHRFEQGLDPQRIEKSAIPAQLIGYGEISSIFKIGDNNDTAYKRMPLFSDRSSAEKYERQYHEYRPGLTSRNMKPLLLKCRTGRWCFILPRRDLPWIVLGIS